VGWLWVRQ